MTTANLDLIQLTASEKVVKASDIQTGMIITGIVVRESKSIARFRFEVVTIEDTPRDWFILTNGCGEFFHVYATNEYTVEVAT